MKILPADKLKEIFEGEPPAYAIHFMLDAPEETSDDDVYQALLAMHCYRSDVRVRAAIKLARKYCIPTNVSAEQEGKILTGITLLVAAIYKPHAP